MAPIDTEILNYINTRFRSFVEEMAVILHLTALVMVGDINNHQGEPAELHPF